MLNGPEHSNPAHFIECIGGVNEFKTPFFFRFALVPEFGASMDAAFDTSFQPSTKLLAKLLLYLPLSEDHHLHYSMNVLQRLLGWASGHNRFTSQSQQHLPAYL
jgi:hypothetical protein